MRGSSQAYSQIDGEVDEDERHGDDQHAPLHEREIAREDPLHHQGAHARPGEDRLGQHGAAEEHAGLDPDHRDDGHQRVLEPVPHHHRPLHQALGPGRADVVLSEDLQHGAPGEAGDDGDGGGGQRHRRQHEVAEEVAQVTATVGREHAGGGQPPQLQREDHHEHDAEPSPPSRL